MLRVAAAPVVAPVAVSSSGLIPGAPFEGPATPRCGESYIAQGDSPRGGDEPDDGQGVARFIYRRLLAVGEPVTRVPNLGILGIFGNFERFGDAYGVFWGYSSAVPGYPVCCGSAKNQRPRGFPVSLKATIFIFSLASQSCFLVNPCAAPRPRTSVVGAGPFARTSVRRIFRRAFSAALPSCGLVSSNCGGRPALNRLNMSFATAVILQFVHRDCRDHLLRCDVDGVPVGAEAWLKIKCVQRAKFPIVGFVKDPAGVAALPLAKRERKDFV